MTAWTWLLVAVLVLVLAVDVLWCVGRARRLDRLHVRVDGGRAALDMALARRAAAALRVAGALRAAGAPRAGTRRAWASPDAALSDTAPGEVALREMALREMALRGSGSLEGIGRADPAERLHLAARNAALAGPDRDARELAENVLTRSLTEVDRRLLDDELHSELVDAEQVVILARRVHNDAVRDTLALRSRRLVRWLRLAGTAPVPAYFEIADPEPDRQHVPAVLHGPSPVR